MFGGCHLNDSNQIAAYDLSVLSKCQLILMAHLHRSTSVDFLIYIIPLSASFFRVSLSLCLSFYVSLALKEREANGGISTKTIKLNLARIRNRTLDGHHFN